MFKTTHCTGLSIVTLFVGLLLSSRLFIRVKLLISPQFLKASYYRRDHFLLSSNRALFYNKPGSVRYNNTSLRSYLGSFFVRAIVSLCLIVTIFVISARPVQAAPSDEELVSIINTINMLLLLEEESLILELNEVDDQSVGVKGSFTTTFEGQGEDLEFCFVVSSREVLNSGALTLRINGVELSGAAQPVLGENCYTIPAGLQVEENTIEFATTNGVSVTVSHAGISQINRDALGLASLSRSGWTEKSVRKVLKIFAFGGHATDKQIQAWANTAPQAAIEEMLNFDQHNLKLSPLSLSERYRQTAARYGEFTDFVENYLSSLSANTPINPDERERFGLNGYAFDDSLPYMITVRGLNPFRQMVGFWETNYHLAVNLDSNVNNIEMAEFYDVIMRAHESGVPYQRVLAEAAKAAAPAAQYGHENNRWINGICLCNDDFAREIHQLYFGIFGEGDEEHHENVTIPNTAAMLTGMPVLFDERPDPENPGETIRVPHNYVTPNTNEHHVGPVQILRNTINGGNAFQKIDALVEFSIEHPESLRNLPVYIISSIADDNLNPARENQLRQAWASMGSNKQFLTFIRSYAISDLFHGPQQRKYLNSFWRTFYKANKFNLQNIEALQAGRSHRLGRPIDAILRNEEVQVFRPTHNVFGGQTSQEASDSSSIFETNYNESTDHDYRWRIAQACEDCDQGSSWVKDWGEVIPSTNGVYRVDQVANWLWNHAVGNFDNYTPLEHAHLVTLLAAVIGGNDEHALDLSLLMCIRADRIERGESPNNLSDLLGNAYRRCRHDENDLFSDVELAALNKSYTVDEITNNGTNTPHIPALISELGARTLALRSSNERERIEANNRISFALAFIFATPFVFAEEGE